MIDLEDMIVVVVIVFGSGLCGVICLSGFNIFLVV